MTDDWASMLAEYDQAHAEMRQQLDRIIAKYREALNGDQSSECVTGMLILTLNKNATLEWMSGALAIAIQRLATQ